MENSPCDTFSTSSSSRNSSSGPTLENASASGVQFPSDSAYNSGHKNSPEDQGSSCQEVIVKILEEKLLKKFYDIGNENIVTKSGRRLFPALMVNVQGLEPATPYNVAFRVISADPYRYRFVNMKWTVVSESEVDQNMDRQISLHPDSPKSGESWMKRPISFKSIKLTHNPKSKSELILLHTMHKYVVEIVFTANPGSKTAKNIVVPLKYTTFIAVVAYQNFDLIDLKIANNPYANCSKEKLQKELELDSARLAFPYYNPYLARMRNPRTYMTPSLAPSTNLQMYNPLQTFGVPVSPLPLPGTSTLSASSSNAPNLPMYNPLPAFGVPPLPLPGTNTVLTSSSTAPNLPTYNPLPAFGVPPLPLSGTNTVLTSSSTVPNLPTYNPLPAFGVPPLPLPGTNTVLTSSSTAPNLPTYNPLPAFGVPPLPLPGTNTVLTSSSTAPNLPTYNPLPAFGVPPLPLSGTNTVLTSSSTAPNLPTYNPLPAFGVPPLLGVSTIPTSSAAAVQNLQMYNPLSLPIPPRQPFYPIPGYTSLFAPVCLNAPAPLGSTTIQTTENNSVPPTTEK